MQSFIQTLISENRNDKLPEEYDYFGKLIIIAHDHDYPQVLSALIR